MAGLAARPEDEVTVVACGGSPRQIIAGKCRQQYDSGLGEASILTA